MSLFPDRCFLRIIKRMTGDLKKTFSISKYHSSAQFARISALLQIQRLRQPALISPLLRFPPLFHIPPVQLPCTLPDNQTQANVTDFDAIKDEKDDNEDNKDLDVV